MKTSVRQIACFECEDAKKWEGYTESLWKEALLEPGDEWTLYKACAGELPTAKEAAQFDAIIIAGSHYSAYEQHEWIDQLMDLLRKLAGQGTRMYGCCFGCQVLARALGGSVGPNPDGDFSHGDQVLQLPPGAVLLASSPTAANELWSWGPNILASQFHVEFDEPLVLQKIWTTLKDVGRLDDGQAECSRRVLEAGGQMNAAMLQVIKHFLRHGIDGAAVPTMAADPPAAGSSSDDATDATATASLCSTSASAIPFSHIAAQRRQQRREQELSEAAKQMIGDAAAAFDMRMEAYGLDLALLQQLNDAAAEQYGATAEIAAALGQFAHDLNARQAAVRDALAALPQLDRQLKLLEAAVGQLDKRSRELESRLGIGGNNAGAGRIAYDYITSSFSRAGSGVGGVAVAAAGGCLGGGALPKQ
ncbi:hypothetical protein OEZ85_002103 [Tetradesmus obliquus]|uniref:Glutamine amidotransferase domain-containing protein n=1 Tax=Tetradesmus obliquus TaxID=3088 RepID=A0ABY8U1X7_TETOB|nr:hypothetical protein OEZ85_002103 [Tetradesmus obliquus]